MPRTRSPRSWRGLSIAAAAATALALVSPTTPASAASHHPAAPQASARTDRSVAATRAAASPTVLLNGLTFARALAVEPSGSLIGAGIDSHGVPTLARYLTSGPRAGNLVRLANLPVDPPTDVAPGPNGSIWVLFGAPLQEGPQPANSPAGKLYRWSPRTTPSLTLVADVSAYAAAHPDPGDLENNPTDSNPYGLAALANGGVLVADAAANALFRVSGSGHVSTVARFPTQVVSTAEATSLGIPGLPPFLPAEAVPTSVVVGPDGNWYVGELKGFPFQPATSKVWRIRAGAHDLSPTPSSNFGRDGVSVYTDGLTSIVDLEIGRDNSAYVLEFARDGVGTAEAAGPSNPPPPAVLLRQSGRGHRTEIATGAIHLPGSVAADVRSGAVYVTDLFLAPGAGRLLRVR